MRGNTALSLLIDIYFIASISQVVLMLVAVYYAIHIMHRIGTFWAWTLMVISFAIFGLRDVASLASVLSTPLSQLAAKSEVFTITSYWPGTILNEAAYATLAVATYGLSTIFSKMAVDPVPVVVNSHDGVEMIESRLDEV